MLPTIHHRGCSRQQMDHEKHPAMARGDQVRPRTVNATLQAWIAAHYNNDCAFALALVAGVVAVVIGRDERWLRSRPT
jgi:predicted exporter